MSGRHAAVDFSDEAQRDEIEFDRRAERRLIPQALLAVVVVVVLVLLREWYL